MLSPRLRCLAAVSLFGLACGCSSMPNPLAWMNGGSTPAAAPPATQPAPTAGASTDAPSPDALAAKVNSYTHDVGPQLNQPGDKPATPSTVVAAPATPAPKPISSASTQNLPQVKWLTPDSLQLMPYSPQVENGATPSARSGAAPAAPSATGDANFPVTVPEGVDGGAAVPASATDPAATSTPQASPVAAPARSGDNIERQLFQHVRDYPKDLEGQLNYELLMFIEDQPVPDMSTMAGMSDEDREVLSAIMDGLSNFRSVLRSGDNLLLASKVKPLLDMDDRLRGQSELNIPSVVLCSEVRSYGVYKPIDSSRFIAGNDNQAIVYCEVQNFQSRPTTDNEWQTQLSQEMVLYTESGLQVWPAKSEPQPVSDLCHQRRHDFFIARLITLPRTLSVGRYLMKVTVTDTQANHVAEATTPVELVAE